MFSHLPAVLALHSPEQTGEVAAHPLPDLRSAETTSETGVQVFKGFRPPLDSSKLVACSLQFLTDHTLLLSRLEKQHTPDSQKCRCRTKAKRGEKPLSPPLHNRKISAL